ncbi:hypothetical protein ABPG74_017432 [Tetrahymena malaccensis]
MEEKQLKQISFNYLNENEYIEESLKRTSDRSSILYDIERPFMEDQNKCYEYIDIPVPPPPPAANNINQSQMIQKHDSQSIIIDFTIRDIKQIEQCRHLYENKYLYITSPQFCFSLILLFFFIGGIVSLIIALVLAIISCFQACDFDCCANCDCGIDCLQCKFDTDCVFTCCRFTSNCIDCTFRSTQVMSYAFDMSYYKSKYNRKKEYHEYSQQNQQKKCPNIFKIIYECLSCSCFETYTLNKPKYVCLLNKVEVYCTNCNSKLRDEYTGLQYICSTISTGIIGFAILGLIVYLYFHLRQ